eukprot:SAG11_NODE_7120_length_1190_cov_0.936755_1_plen_61_part_10
MSSHSIGHLNDGVVLKSIISYTCDIDLLFKVDYSRWSCDTFHTQFHLDLSIYLILRIFRPA